MKLVIYRSKETNVISNFHEVNAYCTAENIKAYNENEKNTSTAEMVELEENSIAYYFYSLKTRTIKEEAKELRELMDDLTAIASRIDDRLFDFDKWLNEERGDQ